MVFKGLVLKDDQLLTEILKDGNSGNAKFHVLTNQQARDEQPDPAALVAAPPRAQPDTKPVKPLTREEIVSPCVIIVG